MNINEFPPGTYYVGDLCYVLKDAVWDHMCNVIMDHPDDQKLYIPFFTLPDGRVGAVYGTMYGDGTYYDQKGKEYGVDAGLIGCVQADPDEPWPEDTSELGNVVEFKRPFRTYEDGNGVIVIGHIRIDTNT